MPVVAGSDDVMEAVMAEMKAFGIEFEVVCETNQIQ
jgi:ribosome maturation protein Sdo1